MNITRPASTAVLFCAACIRAAGVDVAVMDLEPLGIPPEQVQTVTEMLRTEFVRHPRFQVVERDQLSSIMKEQSIQLSGMTSAGDATRVGELLNVRKIVFGSVAAMDSRFVSYVLTLRLVDVGNGAVEVATDIDVASGEHWRESCDKAVARLAAGMGVSATVKVLREEGVYTDYGSALGAEPGDALAVVRIDVIRDDEGKVVMREEQRVAYLRVEDVDVEGSRCVEFSRDGPIEVGMRVCPIDVIPQDGERGLPNQGGIEILSLPSGAKAYLDGELVGVTPAAVEGVEEGAYEVEIRHPGYSSYRGKVRLRGGRHVVVDRELDREVEIEDLLGGGKVPRRQTDPTAALAWSLLPGAGQIYNGDKTLGIMTDLQIVTLGSLSGLLFALAAEEREAVAEKPLTPTTDVWDCIDHCSSEAQADFYTVSASFMAGYAGLAYLYSMLDSYLTADDPFMNPQFAHVRLWPYIYSYSAHQTENTLFSSPGSAQVDSFNAAVSDMSGTLFGGTFSLGYAAKRSDIAMELSIGPDAILLGVDSHLRIPIWTGLSLDGGFVFSGNLSEPPDGTAEEGVLSTLTMFTAPLLGISYRSTRFAASLDFSPWARASANMFLLENADDRWWENETVGGLEGFYLKGTFDAYFGARFGLSGSVAFLALDGGMDELQSLGYSVLDSHRDLFVRLGPVFRF